MASDIQERAQSKTARLRRESLAELVAEGREVRDAGTILGMSWHVTKRMWRRIKGEMGWQAQ